jgi:RNA polymerase sigma factor (sigma-70 family)
VISEYIPSMPPDPRSIPETAELRAMHDARGRFLELVAAVRPDLHRYCARMTGSVADGEDIVQETLARAFYALSYAETMPSLRAWLFSIAHTRAIDHLRRYDVRKREPTDAALETSLDGALDPEDALAREEAVQAALSRFVELPPVQRSCVILKDVLGHSLEEIGALLELSVPAVKAALHRGRAQLRVPRQDAELARTTSPLIARYAALFNARDWDAVRAMLADDARLDLVGRAQRAGRRAVGAYFTNYDAVRDWYLVPAWLDGREVLAVYRDRNDARPSYFVALTFVEDRLSVIQDFRYVPYIAEDARFA